MTVKQKIKVKRKSTNYKNNANLKAAGVEVQLEDWQVDELMKCMEDPIYFIENYVKIIHVDKGLIPFKLYEYQRRYIESLHSHRFTCSKWSRQSGKCVFPDNKYTVRNKNTGEILTLTAEEFHLLLKENANADEC